MAMFPIFVIGLVVGAVLSYTWFMYKKDTPSDVKLEIQEKEIRRQQSDIDMYHKLTDRLYEEIAELKHELESKK